MGIRGAAMRKLLGSAQQDPWGGFLRQAEQARDRGDWAKAAQAYRRAMEWKPNRADVWLQLGHACKESRQFPDALAAYLRSRALEPGPEADLQIGHLLKITSNLHGALHHYMQSAAAEDSRARFELDLMASNNFETGPYGRNDTLRGLLNREPDSRDQRSDGARERYIAEKLFAIGQVAAGKAMLQLWLLRAGLTASRLAEYDAILKAHAVQESQVLIDGLRRASAALSSALVSTDVARSALASEGALNGDPAHPALAGFAILSSEAAEEAHQQPVRYGSEGDIEELSGLVRDLLNLSAAHEPEVICSLAPALRLRAARVLCGSPFVSFETEADNVPVVAHLLSDCVSSFLRDWLPSYLGPLRSRFALERGMVLGWAILPDIQPGESLSPPDASELVDRAVTWTRGRDSSGSGSESSDSLVTERVLVLAGSELRGLSLFNYAMALFERSFHRAGCAMAEAFLLLRPHDIPQLVQCAFALRHHGFWNESRYFFRHVLRHNPFDPLYLLDCVIAEKIAGHFEESARLIRRGIQVEPSNLNFKGEWLEISGEIQGGDIPWANVEADVLLQPILKEQIRHKLAVEPWAFAERQKPANDPAQEFAPEMAPDHHASRRTDLQSERLDVLQVGWERRFAGGQETVVLRGIEAIRVRCVSKVKIAGMRVRLDGRTIHRATALEPPSTAAALRKYIFNVWLDFNEVPVGPHELELYIEELSGGYRRHRQLVHVERPRDVNLFEASDSVVRVSHDAPGSSLEAEINRLPSTVRSAARSVFGSLPKRVLVVRADQIGDFVASIPAIRRLRELLPDAHFCGLVTPGNAHLARSSGLFSEIVEVALQYDHRTKRRHLAIEDQISLRRRLAPLEIDLAIDLSPGTDSRPLLRLAGAKYTAGFKPHDFPWLSFGLDVLTRDPINRRERVSHQSMVLALVDALGGALNRSFDVIPSPDVDPALLQKFGLDDGAPFVVLHSGARLEIKRWPLDSFIELAKLLVSQTKFKVVLLTDGPLLDRTAINDIPEERLILVEGHLAFPELETLIASCAAFVGNDTGPKHLAALRGAKVVSIHMGQVNWNEWGQEGDGFIVSRRVPCCGCGIEDAEDCGQDLACLVNIRPEEIAQAVQQATGRP